MENKSKQDQHPQIKLNDYEKCRLLRVKQNKEKLHQLGVKNIAKSITSLAVSQKKKKRKEKTTFTNEEHVDYMCDYGGETEGDNHEGVDTSAKVPTKQDRPKYIAPMSMNRYANIAKKQRVFAPKATAVLQVNRSRTQNGQHVDSSAANKNKSPLCEEGRKSNTKRNLIPKSIPSGAKRKLFLIDEDNEYNELEDDVRSQDMNKEEYCDENVENEDIEEMVYENVQNGIEGEDTRYRDVNEVDNEQDWDEYEDTNHMIVDNTRGEIEGGDIGNDLDNEDDDDELVEKQHEARVSTKKTAFAVGKNARRRVRGPTCMKKIWGESKLINVQFNKCGQPVDKDTTSQLTHFMGSVARSGKYCPIYKPWPKVSDKKKHKLLELFKTKFDLPPRSYDWILASFAKKVKNWRGRLKEFYDKSLPLQEQLKSKPKRVHRSHWRRLVKYWNKEKSKKLSDKNKENRAKKKMVQVTGKKSFARVHEELKISSGCEPSRMDMFRAIFSKDGTTKNKEAASAIEQMQEFRSQLPDGSTDEPGPEDTFSKVMGKDQSGNARMFGLGVRASDVWGVIPSRSACRRENLELKSENEQLTAKLARYEAKESETERSSKHGFNDSSIPLRVGSQVYLRSIINPTETVAKGRIKSLDPDDVVGGEEIGPGWCEVDVKVPIKRRERLVRPYGVLVTIQDAVGASAAWPCTLISVVPEDEDEDDA